MRIYYRGPDALITGSQFVWLAETPRVFAISDLRDAHITRREVSGARAPAATAAAAVTALALVPAYTMMPSLAARLSLVGVMALIVTLVILRRRTASHWELVAAFSGRRVTIYAAGDRTTFHQVTRALGRVLESGPVAGERPRSMAA